MVPFPGFDPLGTTYHCLCRLLKYSKLLIHGPNEQKSRVGTTTHSLYRLPKDSKLLVHGPNAPKNDIGDQPYKNTAFVQSPIFAAKVSRGCIPFSAKVSRGCIPFSAGIPLFILPPGHPWRIFRTTKHRGQFDLAPVLYFW